MKKALAIGAIAATALLLAACQQPKPAAVETPTTTPSEVTTPATTTEPSSKLEVTGGANIMPATTGEVEPSDTLKVTGSANITGESASGTQLTITPSATITETMKSEIKVEGAANVVPANQ